MNVFDLFSGIGGFSIGLERAGMKTVAFCEIEPYPQAVLRKNFPGVPIYDDVRTVTAERLRADGIDTVDLVCGGDPCQPHSCAGKRRGQADDRYLWPEMLRIVQEFNPTWVINENVTGSESNLVLDQKIADLENAGYECQPFNIPACSVGAWHTRERIWLVAHSERYKQPRQESRNGAARRVGWEFKLMAWNRDWESALCEFRGMDDGLSYGVDRLDTLRNTVMPQIPEIIGRAIMQVSCASSLHQ